MKREEAWKHVRAVINDLGEMALHHQVPGAAWMERARLVVWITPMRHAVHGPFSIVSTIAVVHRDLGLRLGDKEAAELATVYGVKTRGERPPAPAHIL